MEHQYHHVENTLLEWRNRFYDVFLMKRVATYLKAWSCFTTGQIPGRRPKNSESCATSKNDIRKWAGLYSQANRLALINHR